jgi:hypothetical protein
MLAPDAGARLLSGFDEGEALAYFAELLTR